MTPQANRLISLDAMRGFTIAAMILVNFPGNEDFVYAPLKHSVWNGLTPTDIIAPFFLFIVGVSIALAYTKRLKQKVPKGDMYKKIVIRSFKIFAIGILLNLLWDFNFAELRWTGTLPRIAIVFLACAILFLNTDWKKQAWIGGGVLVAYWLAMTLIPTPGVGKVMLEPGVNLAAWIDSKYLPGTMWQGTWDPEGILSTFPSIVSGITGMLAGTLILNDRTREEQVIHLMVIGFFMAIAGYIWGLTFPVNENIWTSSFVLVTSGFAFLALGVSIYVVDMKGYTQGTKFGIIYGANAITAYVMGDIFAAIFYGINYGSETLNIHFFNAFTSIGLGEKFTGMIYSLIYVFIVFIPTWILFKKKIFIKL
ncbi:MAG: heparan-alpha-glucosaminide N-acetyltransferase domain-containing protein [Cyclobacteriaceae bacterium]